LYLIEGLNLLRSTHPVSLITPTGKSAFVRTADSS